MKIPLKNKIFAWYLRRGVILTKDNLIKRNWHGSPQCVSCHHDETIKHLFFQCKLARSIWLSTDVPVRSVYGRLYNVWRIKTCLRRCVHAWRPRREILLPDMDGSMIFGLALQRLRCYTVSTWLLVFRLFRFFWNLDLDMAVCISVMQRPGVMLKPFK